MSIHLVECAAALPLRPASKKLVLMAFADSASKDTRIAYPGLEQVMVWSGLKKSRTLEVVDQLVELELLFKVKKAHTGRRAEYAVFPTGCCSLHGPLTGYGTPDPLAGLTGSEQSDTLALSTASGTPDPLSASGSDLGKRGSDFAAKEGPVAVGPLPSTYSGITPVCGTDQGESHHASWPVDPHEQISSSLSAAVASLPGHCGNCDPNRWLTDKDGLPLIPCPDCHPSSARRAVSA